jgi:hypothetical protein
MWCLLLLILFIVTLTFNAVLQLIPGAPSIFDFSNWTNPQAVQAIDADLILRKLMESMVQTVMMVYAVAVWVVFYFSQRCKREGYDLALRLERLMAVK